jgi:hypothetical protein
MRQDTLRQAVLLGLLLVSTISLAFAASTPRRKVYIPIARKAAVVKTPTATPRPAQPTATRTPTPRPAQPTATRTPTSQPSQPTPTRTPIATSPPTAVPTGGATLAGPPPASGKRFSTLSVGASLPSGSDCASRIRRTSWEPRPDNNDENKYIPQAGNDYTLTPWGGVDPRANNDFLARVDGKFTGTTDEILQWGACKWGLDEDVVRAIGVRESMWHMSVIGPNGDDIGILQIRSSVWKGSYPASRKSTAFNVDYTLARWRACYSGYITYLKENYPTYGSGDLWGCVGHWYSGRWKDAEAEKYVELTKTILQTRKWEQADFGDHKY